jgi:hypothetical protein
MVSDDDKITVAENYCIACEGECINDDPADYDHLMVDWDSISGAWMDRGASASDVWSFLASVLLSIAKNNDVTWEELQEVLQAAWQKGEEYDE